MNCPDDGTAMVHWSIPQMGQYGWGCPTCRMFVCAPNIRAGDSTMVAVCPLDEVFLPRAYERVPAYRRMVGMSVAP